MGEIEDINYSGKEYIQNHKEKKEISAETKKIEGQTDRAFNVKKKILVAEIGTFWRHKI